MKAATNGSTVRYDVASNFAGSEIRVTGNTQLVKDYPTTADANFRNLPVERILAVAKEDDRVAVLQCVVADRRRGGVQRGGEQQ